MKGLETGRDKIQKICDALKKETLEPAKQEAREIVENAHLQASEILLEAKEKAEKMILSAKDEIEEKGKIFQASLQLACRQSIELLKQKIEQQLFDGQLDEVLSRELTDPKVISQIINTLMKSMENQGVEDEFVALIPKQISPRSINALLMTQVLERLQHKSVSLGDFDGGVEIQLKGRRVSIDISKEAVRGLIARYIRRDFREMVFSG